MTTQEFIETLNDFAGPISPLDDGDYSDPATIGNNRKKWFATKNPKEVASCLAEVIIKQPACVWPEREFMYKVEIGEIAGLLRNSVHAKYVYNAIIPYISDPSKRSLIIDVLGYLGIEEGVLIMAKLDVFDLTDDELMLLPGSLNMIGGEKAIEYLNDLKLKVPAEKTAVHEQIDIALNYPYQG